MLSTTYNKIYTCDCCGKHETYVHHREDWIPAGWFEVKGYNGPLHLCRECFRKAMPARVTDLSPFVSTWQYTDKDGHTVTYRRVSDVERTYTPKDDDDYEDYIGLTD